jgi:hypothetical protein
MHERRPKGTGTASAVAKLNLVQRGGIRKMQAGCAGMGRRGIQHEKELFNAYQFVYAWQSKFQSTPLCAVDAASPSLQTGSLFHEEGVYETKTDFAGDIIGRGGRAAGSAFV